MENGEWNLGYSYSFLKMNIDRRKIITDYLVKPLLKINIDSGKHQQMHRC